MKVGRVVELRISEEIEFHMEEDRIMKDLSKAAVRWGAIYKSEGCIRVLREWIEDLNNKRSEMYDRLRDRIV